MAPGQGILGTELVCPSLLQFSVLGSPNLRTRIAYKPRTGGLCRHLVVGAASRTGAKRPPRLGRRPGCEDRGRAALLPRGTQVTLAHSCGAEPTGLVFPGDQAGLSRGLAVTSPRQTRPSSSPQASGGALPGARRRLPPPAPGGSPAPAPASLVAEPELHLR